MQASNRGKAFGALYLTGSLGGMFGSLYATNLGKAHVSYNILNVTTLANHCIHQFISVGLSKFASITKDDSKSIAKHSQHSDLQLMFTCLLQNTGCLSTGN